MKEFVLAINPGSTTTKLAIFQEETEVKSHTIEYTRERLNGFNSVAEQLNLRFNDIKKWLKEENFNLEDIKVVVGRGGMLKSIPGGTYLVTDAVIDDLKSAKQGDHASNLGGLLARQLADIIGVHSYIVDPVSVDEFKDIARISGIKEIPRKSMLHALNIKRVMHKRANELNKTIEDLNFIVAHLGGGISIAAAEKGKLVDVNNANEGGPFSPERTGTLPVADLVELCFSGEYSLDEVLTMIQGQGGLYSYLNTTDAREVVERIQMGDDYAKFIYDSMAYQVNKEIACMATVLSGNVDNIILTGGLSYDDYLVEKITEGTSFISDILVYPGESEMEALNLGVLRVINNIEKHKIYEDEVVEW